MAYRLRVRIGGRERRLALPEGDATLGSSAECALRIQHPTVSRRHARVTVDHDGCRIADLGSSNGTRLDGRSVRGEVSLPVGALLELGSVQAVLEEVSAADLEAGVELSTPPPPAVASGTHPAASTIGPASFETFVAGELPRLVERVARGERPEVVAQAVGAALHGTLPCRRVAVLRQGDAAGAGVLFEGLRGDGDQAVTPVTADAGDGWSLVLELTSAGSALRHSPLAEVGAGLIRAARRAAGSPMSSSPPPPPAPAPPDPPSLVPEVREIYERAARVAASGVSVLILGESGTGKELLARYVHAASDRADRPLVALNCAALPRDLLEAELFGVERGVATGVDARAGVFEAAHGGTLFLDEIGDMAPETQARILRVLEARQVHRVGGHAAHPADVRIIAATNRRLEALLDDGRFRRDLYHRIADWVVELPPLRRRRADVPNLAAHFLARAAAERGVRPAGISRAAVDALTAYPWPGNVRELEKEIGRAALFLDDDQLLDTTDLRPAIAEAAATPPDDTLRSVRERAERDHIRRILAECGGSVPDAAERLGVGVSTLYARMKALGLG